MSRLPLELFARIAWTFVECHDREALEYYCRTTTPSEPEPAGFLAEYVWCVFCAGFSARVLSKRWGKIREAYLDFRLEGPVDRAKVLAAFGHVRKVDATLRVRHLIMSTGWSTFWGTYGRGPETLQWLPYLGPVLARHLARNLGWPVAKDDLHLRRLCSAYGFPDAQTLCEAVAGILDKPVGAADYALWCYCASLGTTQWSRPVPNE